MFSFVNDRLEIRNKSRQSYMDAGAGWEVGTLGWRPWQIQTPLLLPTWTLTPFDLSKALINHSQGFESLYNCLLLLCFREFVSYYHHTSDHVDVATYASIILFFYVIPLLFLIKWIKYGRIRERIFRKAVYLRRQDALSGSLYWDGFQFGNGLALRDPTFRRAPET